VPAEHYRLAINFVAAPGRIDGMVDTVYTILDSVRTADASPFELRAITAMQRRTWENLLQDNHFWLQAIEQYDRLGIPFDKIVLPVTTPVTAAEIRAAAQRYLPTTDYMQRIVMPRDTALRAETDSTEERPAKRATGTKGRSTRVSVGAPHVGTVPLPSAFVASDRSRLGRWPAQAQRH
jgi:hypothetical protein